MSKKISYLYGCSLYTHDLTGRWYIDNRYTYLYPAGELMIEVTFKEYFLPFWPIKKTRFVSEKDVIEINDCGE